MTLNRPPNHLYVTPFLVSVFVDDFPTSFIQRLIYQELQESPNPEQITLINEEKKTITIDMIRALNAEMSYASLQGKKRHLVLLHVELTTIEAQNAVLKLLEEPPKNTQFWLLTKTPQALLPTIISRCQEIVFAEEEIEKAASFVELTGFIENLSSLSYRELIEEAETYPDKATALEFVDSLISSVHQQQSAHPQTKHHTILTKLLQTKQYLNANVSPKLALEECFFFLKQSLS